MCAIALASCAPQSHPTRHGGIDYPYGPSSIQLHSLSHLEISPDNAISGGMVCIEFTDRENQTTRATGLLELTITPPDRAPFEKMVNLSDLSINEAAWDRPTRMYQVRFAFEPALGAAPAEGIAVAVTWTPVDRSSITVRGSLQARVGVADTSVRTSP